MGLLKLTLVAGSFLTMLIINNESMDLMCCSLSALLIAEIQTFMQTLRPARFSPLVSVASSSEI